MKMVASTLTVEEALSQETPELFIFRRDAYRKVTDFDADDLETSGVICVITGGYYYAMRKDARPFFVKRK